MFELSQSATGQFVLVHRPSQTVIVGDDLAATWERMRERVGERAGPEVAVAVPTAPPSPRARTAAIGLLVGLAFAWLGVLHLSLGRLASELRGAPSEATQVPLDDLRARVDRVERQLEVGTRGSKRPAGKRPGKPRPAEAGAAATEAAEPAAAPENDDD